MNVSPAGSPLKLHIALLLLVAALALVSLSIGVESINLVTAFRDVLEQPDSVDAIILRELRLPRTLIGIIAGATLGLCGAAMQGLLRNPLASPGLVGSASGAALGAVAVLYFGIATQYPQAVPLAGMAGSLIATSLVYLLSGRDASVTTLILAGVAINALATACMSLLLNFAPSPYAMRELVLWTLGDISDRSLVDVRLMLPCTLLGWLLLAGCGRQLDALTLGERTAQSLGVKPDQLRWRIFIAVSLAVGAAVATTGMIGFIGLVVPHLIRPWVGYEPRKLLLSSALGGAALLLAADIGVRLIPTQSVLKVGVLTSLVGAPFFLHLILRSRRHGLR
ncbi:ABC transporter permease [Chromatiales bacterium (ex Bugula neritina AB1)]|nr:ABC transporter permease [Chromatiales bacterium (ex Bugula neritina AB1)]